MSAPDSHKLWSHKKPQPYEISYETVRWVSSSESRFSIIKRFLDNRDYPYVISSVCSFLCCYTLWKSDALILLWLNLYYGLSLFATTDLNPSFLWHFNLNVYRVQNRKLKEQVSIQDTQIQALQDSLREIEDQATRQKETTKKLSELEIERDDLKELVSKLSEQLGNLSAEQNTFNSRNSTPC